MSSDATYDNETTWTNDELVRNFNEVCSKHYSGMAEFLPELSSADFRYDQIVSPRYSSNDHSSDKSRQILSFNSYPLDEARLHAYIASGRPVPEELVEELLDRSKHTQLVIQIFHHEAFGQDVPMTSLLYVKHIRHIVRLSKAGLSSPGW